MPMRERLPDAAPPAKAPAPCSTPASVPAAGPAPVPAPGPAGVLALQRTIGNRAVAALLQRAAAARRPPESPTARPALGQVVQRLIVQPLDAADYGTDAVSAGVLDMRLSGHGISPRMNVATFHFVNRQDGSDAGVVTEASGGSAEYANNSHSESRIIYALNEETAWGGNFPRRKVIDWVYTERAACQLAGYRNELVGGCLNEIATIEKKQNDSQWDPIGYSSDGRQEITVYYTFEGGRGASGEIEDATIYGQAVRALADGLNGLGEPDAVDRARECLWLRDDYDKDAVPTHSMYEWVVNERVNRALDMARLRREAEAWRGAMGGVRDWIHYLDNPDEYWATIGW